MCRQSSFLLRRQGRWGEPCATVRERCPSTGGDRRVGSENDGCVKDFRERTKRHKRETLACIEKTARRRKRGGCKRRDRILSATRTSRKSKGTGKKRGSYIWRRPRQPSTKDDLDRRRSTSAQSPGNPRGAAATPSLSPTAPTQEAGEAAGRFRDTQRFFGFP